MLEPRAGASRTRRANRQACGVKYHRHVLAPDRFRGYPYRVRLMTETLPLDDSLIVAELGCGPAFVAEAIAPRVRRLVGFEIATGTVDALDEQDLPENLDVVPGDACDTTAFGGFAGAFDLVYSTDTLEHVPDASAFFATIALVLKPDGKAVVLFPNEEESSRHGVTAFETGAELAAAIGDELLLDQAFDVAQRGWAKSLYSWGWKRPLRLGKKATGVKPASDNPQTFDETVAGRYGFARRRSFGALNAYGRALVAHVGDTCRVRARAAAGHALHPAARPLPLAGAEQGRVAGRRVERRKKGPA